MKLVICGSRDLPMRSLLWCLRAAINNLGWRPSEVVSGGARGGDFAGECWAEDNRIPIKWFPADWKTHGKKAGFLRNAQMVEYADAVLALWDGKSAGTKHTIDLAKKAGKKCWVVRVDIMRIPREGER